MRASTEGVPNYTDYKERLGQPDSKVFMRVWFRTDRGSVTRYSVVLFTRERDSRGETVCVFDNTHGVHDMHRYTRRTATKGAADTFHSGTPGEALGAAKAIVKAGWEGMLEAWRR